MPPPSSIKGGLYQKTVIESNTKRKDILSGYGTLSIYAVRIGCRPSRHPACPQTGSRPATDSNRAIIPVHCDAAKGDITVDSKT